MTEKRAWLYDLLFILVLLIAATLRLTGLNWGEGHHQHPDELFLSSVLESLRAHTCTDPGVPVDSCPEDKQRWLTLAEIYDSSKSTLNPYNRGQAFFVYGNLPFFIVRYAAEITGTTGLAELKFFSRQFSAMADLFTIFFLYLIVSRVYGRRVGLLASLFSALTVMQIQQSHFFTTDLFTNAFMFLAIWFAVEIVTWKEKRVETRELEIGEFTEGTASQSPVSSLQTQTSNPPIPQHLHRTQVQVLPITNPLFRLLTHPLLLYSVGFGVALGMAMASKINAGVLAFLLPAAFAVRYLTVDRKAQIEIAEDSGLSNSRKPLITDYWLLITAFLIAGGLATIISFRLFQPYAFDGLMLNPQWIANIREQRAQATGEADLPWNLQWARRSHLYSGENLTIWGLGLPLGILAWTGFLLMGWRILKGEWRHLLLWGWTAFYFVWQSLQFNPTMRYQLPVYPLLAMMAAWAVLEAPQIFGSRKTQNTARIIAYSIGTIVVILTAAWAFAFHSIYLRPEPRVAASRWIYANVPGPINLQIQSTDNGDYNHPLPYPLGGTIQAGTSYSVNFTPKSDGTVTGVMLAHALPSASPSAVNLSIASTTDPATALARASATVDFTASDDSRGPAVTFTLDQPLPVRSDVEYTLTLESPEADLSLTGASIANETDYDWNLPFRMDGYDAFSGLYRGDLILQVYWDDNPDKLIRFVDVLSQTDYIFIPTNHQYAQITRVPERYPLTTLYYRELLGCP
ncbi:MAG: glycosyltransferase family 39 protein, partial [Chloroflexota bacterium]